MFIPIDIGQKEYKKGDVVVSIKEIRTGYGFFTVGHEFTVMGKVPKYSSFRLTDNEHNIVIKTEPDNFTLKTDIDEARTICIDITEKRKAISFIKEHCSQQDFDFDEYDKYTSCKLKKGYSNNACTCKLSCIGYVNSEKIDKNDFMKIYLRKIKIKKLKN